MTPYHFFIIVCCLTSPLNAKRGGGGYSGRSSGSHYPASSGLSGNTHHPVSTGLSGNTHYPSSTGLSGNTHYPSSTGLSGNTHYPRASPAQSSATQTHNYPQTTGLSGNRNVQHGVSSSHRTEVHHYHYSPPQQISYGSVQHPVYHGQPPVYVYQYRDSGSRFDNLLTGLALYNLGRMSADNHHYDNRNHMEYKRNPGEICKMRIEKRNGEYEETRIDCKLISSFIWEEQREQHKQSTNVTRTVSVVQNVTVNGSSTVTVQNTTVVDALQVKGPSITVTPEMKCFMIRISNGFSNFKRKVECGLLQEYATRSLQYNNSQQILPGITILLLVSKFLFFIN